MMTGDELLQRAMRLVGCTDHRGEIDRTAYAELFARGTTLINTILTDVQPIEGTQPQEICTLADELPVSDLAARGVMPYGVAMLLAQCEGNGTDQQVMASIYEQKRGSIRRPAERVIDTVPSPA